jgi:hypothetical protein
MPFPTSSEFNNLVASSYNSGTNVATNYTVANNEKPVLASKWRGFIKGLQDLISWLYSDVRILTNNTYRVRAYRDQITTCPANTNTKIIFNVDNQTISGSKMAYDLNNNYDTTTGRYTAPVSGWYLIATQLNTNSASAGGPSGVIAINGNNLANGGFARFSLVPSSDSINGSTTVWLNQNDYIEIYILCGAGGGTSLALATGRYDINYMTIDFIGF